MMSKEEYMVFDKTVTNELTTKRVIEYGKEVGKDETIDYKMALATGYIQGAAEMKIIFIQYLQDKKILEKFQVINGE